MSMAVHRDTPDGKKTEIFTFLKPILVLFKSTQKNEKKIEHFKTKTVNKLNTKLKVATKVNILGVFTYGR